MSVDVADGLDGRTSSDWRIPAVAFAVNGALYGSLLTRFPEIADRVSASETQFGVVLFAAAIGGLLGSLVAPLLARAVGERSATLLAGAGYALLAVGVAWAPQLILLGGALLLLGVLDGAHDVAMNAFAVRVQQHRATTLMGRMHATWSLSLAGAGVLGTVAAGLRVPVALHVGLAATVALAAQLAIALGRKGMVAEGTPAPTPPVDGPPASAPTGRRPSTPATTGDSPSTPATTGVGPSTPVRTGVGPSTPVRTGDSPARPARTLRRLRYVLPVLGLAAVAASYVESPGQEWTGLLLSRGFDATPQVAAAAPVLFGAGLLASRLLLDAAVSRVGQARVAAVSGATMMTAVVVGLLCTLLAAPVWWALVAVAVAGFGAGPAFPLLFGSADQLSVRHGIPPARTASMVSALSRVGAISAPIVVGPLTDAFGMGMVFAIMAVGAALVLGALPRAVR
ncbi:MFS transporter [Micromonospora sp. WMMD964]|uniref:MFS transporter n=1 Tax=Micromonospora sp. WMMD964 TaxID=3016091 RepID=UPI00249B2E92|nr:MFS transporter [Micromonospora sp. WMMD964]WFF04045.1 MFS transporter [Micromonospora sp. WMMD964]